METNVKTGIKGEQIAAKHLKKQGYKILGKNIRFKWGEIDIVAKDSDGTLVFIEVKTLRKEGQNGLIDKFFYLKPEDNLTRSKYKKLSKACVYFSNKHPSLINLKKGWRIDLLSLTIYENSCDINHYKSIGGSF